MLAIRDSKVPVEHSATMAAAWRGAKRSCAGELAVSVDR